jgi:hypothetical protein
VLVPTLLRVSTIRLRVSTYVYVLLPKRLRVSTTRLRVIYARRGSHQSQTCWLWEPFTLCQITQNLHLVILQQNKASKSSNISRYVQLQIHAREKYTSSSFLVSLLLSLTTAVYCNIALQFTRNIPWIFIKLPWEACSQNSTFTFQINRITAITHSRITIRHSYWYWHNKPCSHFTTRIYMECSVSACWFCSAFLHDTCHTHLLYTNLYLCDFLERQSPQQIPDCSRYVYRTCKLNWNM